MWHEINTLNKKPNHRYFLDETRASLLKRASLENGLNPDMPRLRSIYPGESIKSFINQYECLHIESLDLFSQIHKKLDDPKCVFILTDAMGTVVELFSSPAVMEQCRMRGLSRGATLSYMSCGVNAVSQAIHDKQAVAMKGRQHFLGIFQNWICFAVPIFGPKGELVGCVDCSMGEETYLNEKIIFTKRLAEEFSRVILEVRSAYINLTVRQQQIIRLLERGRSSKEVAAILSINPRTVETTLRRMRFRYRVKSNIELVIKIMKDPSNN